MDDIVERLRKKVFHGPTMQASHTKTVEWLAADEIDRLRNDLAFYADGSNWRMGGPLDPNSGNFTGGPARAAIEHTFKRK